MLSYHWMEWSRPGRGRRTILYRRSLHRAVALDPDTLEWWSADLQPWRAGPVLSGLEVALRSPLPRDCLPDGRTHGLAVAVVKGDVALEDAAEDLFAAFCALPLPDMDARPWEPLPRRNFM